MFYALLQMLFLSIFFHPEIDEEELDFKILKPKFCSQEREKRKEKNTPKAYMSWPDP